MTIERAKQLAKQWANGYVCSLREGEAEEYHKLCFSAIQEQQENPFSGWISVKDKLPEVGDWDKNVLTINDVGQFRVAYYDGHCWRNSIGEIVDWLAPITHWMPLPCPPQEV